MAESILRDKSKESATQMCFFQLYSPCGEFYAQVRDMSFGRDMRFARWKLQGEYNITAEQSGAISLRALRVISR